MSLDPIYYTDKYPRDGCFLTIRVESERAALAVSAPNGAQIESYAFVPHAEIPRMVAEWLAGDAPKTGAS